MCNIGRGGLWCQNWYIPVRQQCFSVVSRSIGDTTENQTRKMVMIQRLSSRKFSFQNLFSGFQWNLVLKVKRKKNVVIVFRESTFIIWILSIVQCVNYWAHMSVRFPHFCLKTGTDPVSERQRFKFYFESGMMAKPKWCRF